METQPKTADGVLMYWLTFLFLSLILYVPPLNLARRAWAWAAPQYWEVPLIHWHWPAWAACLFWLTVSYLAVAMLLHLAQRRLPRDSRLGRAAERISRASLGALGVLTVAVAVLVVVFAWPILPAMHLMYGWRYSISFPIGALAYLYVLAEALRLAEDNIWADRAFEAWRREWIIEHGYYR